MPHNPLKYNNLLPCMGSFAFFGGPRAAPPYSAPATTRLAKRPTVAPWTTTEKTTTT